VLLIYSIYTIYLLQKGDAMGHKVKMQKVDRPTNQSYYINFPSALAQALEIDKGEDFEWLVENKNLLVLKRVRTKRGANLKSITK